jgi:NADH dehydrogenase [ubiquinone] 1 alpha subcomplex assembly factor 6
MQRFVARSLPSQTRHFATSRAVQLPNLNQAVSSGGPESPTEYCAALVRKLDPEAWLCSYFWPKDARAAWLGWRAFNVSRLRWPSWDSETDLEV